MARQEIAAPDGPETHVARKRVPVTQSTILSSGTVNGADTLTIEVIQPDSMPAAVRIVWPIAATITTPVSYPEVGSGEPVVGEVGLPHFVGLLGGEADVGGFRFLVRLRGDQSGALQGAPDRGLRHCQPVLLSQMPGDGLGAGIQTLPGQLTA